MHIVSRVYAQGADYAAGTERITYASAYDGAQDWCCYTPGDSAQRAVVFLHGAFSEGDQLYTRADLRAFWLTRVLAGRHPLIALNMRGTSYMNPAAAADAHAVLTWAPGTIGWRSRASRCSCAWPRACARHTAVPPLNSRRSMRRIRCWRTPTVCVCP